MDFKQPAKNKILFANAQTLFGIELNGIFCHPARFSLRLIQSWRSGRGLGEGNSESTTTPHLSPPKEGEEVINGDYKHEKTRFL
jgi:hypothetical protein